MTDVSFILLALLPGGHTKDLSFLHERSINNLIAALRNGSMSFSRPAFFEGSVFF